MPEKDNQSHFTPIEIPGMHLKLLHPNPRKQNKNGKVVHTEQKETPISYFLCFRDEREKASFIPNVTENHV